MCYYGRELMHIVLHKIPVSKSELYNNNKALNSLEDADLSKVIGGKGFIPKKFGYVEESFFKEMLDEK